MSAQHTPGPWQISPDEDGSYLRIRGTRLGSRFKVANVMAPKDFLPKDDLESKANARLIAAAPEMLAELSRQLDREHNPYEPDNQSATYYRIKALIAKATGGGA